MKSGAIQTITQRSKEEQEKVEADMVQQREEWDRKRKTKVPLLSVPSLDPGSVRL